MLRRNVFFAALVFLACLVIGAWLLRKGDGGPRADKQLPPQPGDNEKQLVKEYLLRTVKDPSEMEILDWLEPRFVLIKCPTGLVAAQMANAGANWVGSEGDEKSPVSSESTDALARYKPGIIMHARIRSKSEPAGTAPGEQLFLIIDGKIVGTEPVGEAGLRYALMRLGDIAAERAGAKVTKVIVRGKLSYQGRPLKLPNRGGEDFSLAFVSDKFTPLGEPALAIPPRYELSGISPGKYIVTISWRRLVERPWERTDIRLERIRPENDRRRFDSLWMDLLGGAYSIARTPLSCTVTDERGIQYFDFDLNGR